MHKVAGRGVLITSRARRGARARRDTPCRATPARSSPTANPARPPAAPAPSRCVAAARRSDARPPAEPSGRCRRSARDPATPPSLLRESAPHAIRRRPTSPKPPPPRPATTRQHPPHHAAARLPRVPHPTRRASLTHPGLRRVEVSQQAQDSREARTASSRCSKVHRSYT